MGDAAEDTLSGNGTDEWCEFSDLLKVTCSHCKDAERKKAPGRVPRNAAESSQFRNGGFRTATQVFTKLAEFESDCDACFGEIGVGEPIKQDADGVWIHEECP